MFVLASNHRCSADTYMTVFAQRSQTSSFVGLTCKVSDKHGERAFIKLLATKTSPPQEKRCSARTAMTETRKAC
jgi:hypothetical protein